MERKRTLLPWLLVSLTGLVPGCGPWTLVSKDLQYAGVVVSVTDGLVGRPFSSQLSFTGAVWDDSELFEDPPSISDWNAELRVEGPLPPGLRFDGERRQIEGTPREPGIWRVRVRYRDRDDAAERWYSQTVELHIFDAASSTTAST